MINQWQCLIKEFVLVIDTLESFSFILFRVILLAQCATFVSLYLLVLSLTGDKTFWSKSPKVELQTSGQATL